LRGHELHYSAVEPSGAALVLRGTRSEREDGWASSTLLATYLHLHTGSDPSPAERFVAAAAGLSVASPLAAQAT